MIYLDHAATSYPKSLSVRKAAMGAIGCYGANPGRGAYPMAIATAEQLYNCRERAATLFGLSDPRRVIFTLNCTAALNTVIKSVLADGGRAVVSDLEHNAVMRPLHALSPRYPCYDIAKVDFEDDEATVQAFRRAITPKTKAIICAHASNVIGCVLPIAKLASLAHEYGIVIIVDAAQSAGHCPIHMERDGIDYMCAAGHKGLGGTMGTGLLLCRTNDVLKPLIEGGTGSASLSLDQPLELPERLESGTPNVAGICALGAGIERVLDIGVERIAEYERRLGTRLYDALSSLGTVRLYSTRPCRGRAASVISLRVNGREVEEIGQRLSRYGIAARCGLHCAPMAHKKIGTLPDGTVRLSVGMSNTVQEMEAVFKFFEKIR